MVELLPSGTVNLLYSPRFFLSACVYRIQRITQSSLWLQMNKSEVRYHRLLQHLTISIGNRLLYVQYCNVFSCYEVYYRIRSMMSLSLYVKKPGDFAFLATNHTATDQLFTRAYRLQCIWVLVPFVAQIISRDGEEARVYPQFPTCKNIFFAMLCLYCISKSCNGLLAVVHP